MISRLQVCCLILVVFIYEIYCIDPLISINCNTTNPIKGIVFTSVNINPFRCASINFALQHINNYLLNNTNECISVDIFDTKRDWTIIEKIVSNISFSKYDFVIGPDTSSNVNNLLNLNKIPKSINHITPSATMVGFNIRSRLFMYTAGDNEQEAKAMLKLTQNFKVLSLHLDNPYSNDLNQQILDIGGEKIKSILVREPIFENVIEKILEEFESSSEVGQELLLSGSGPDELTLKFIEDLNKYNISFSKGYHFIASDSFGETSLSTDILLVAPFVTENFIDNYPKLTEDLFDFKCGDIPMHHSSFDVFVPYSALSIHLAYYSFKNNNSNLFLDTSTLDKISQFAVPLEKKSIIYNNGLPVNFTQVLIFLHKSGRLYYGMIEDQKLVCDSIFSSIGPWCLFRSTNPVNDNTFNYLSITLLVLLGILCCFFACFIYCIWMRKKETFRPSTIQGNHIQSIAQN